MTPKSAPLFPLLSPPKVREQHHAADRLYHLHGRAGLGHWREAQCAEAPADGPAAGPEGHLRPLQPLPVSADGPGEVERGQKGHPHPVGPNTASHEDAHHPHHPHHLPLPGCAGDALPPTPPPPRCFLLLGDPRGM